jgi:hypothetical protein
MKEAEEIMRKIEGTFNDYITGADDDLPDDNSFLNAIYKIIKPHIKTNSDKLKINLINRIMNYYYNQIIEIESGSIVIVYKGKISHGEHDITVVLKQIKEHEKI